MTTIRARLKVGADGTIIVPVGVDEAGKEVSVTVMPVDAPDTINGIPRDQWWQIFNRTEGSIPDFMVPEERVIDPVPYLGDELTYLLDTNACVVHLRKRGRGALSQRLGAINLNSVAVCSVVRAELLAGAHHGKAPQDELARVLELLSLFRSLPFDDSAADRYGRVRAHIESLGIPIGSNDLMIASIALANGLIVVTHNCAEFLRVPELKVEDWQASP